MLVFGSTRYSALTQTCFTSRCAAVQISNLERGSAEATHKQRRELLLQVGGCAWLIYTKPKPNAFTTWFAERAQQHAAKSRLIIDSLPLFFIHLLDLAFIISPSEDHIPALARQHVFQG